jgi:hypothetical protein
MANPTIVWTIDWLKTSTQTVNGFQEVVVDAGWRCTGTETAGTPAVTYTNSIYGTCTFTEPPAGDPNFVPFAQLTQSEVIDWCWANGVNQSATEAAIANNLNLQINPLVTQPPLPWAQA